MKKEFDLPKTFITIDQNIVHIKFKDKVIIEKNDAELISNTIVDNIDKNISYGQITDISAIDNMTREARDFFASKKGDFIKLNAIVMLGAIQKTLTNMYFLFSKPRIESKVFNNYNSAFEWIKNNLKLNN